MPARLPHRLGRPPSVLPAPVVVLVQLRPVRVAQQTQGACAAEVEAVKLERPSRFRLRCCGPDHVAIKNALDIIPEVHTAHLREDAFEWWPRP